MNNFDKLHPSFKELAFTLQYFINLGFPANKLYSFIDNGKLYFEYNYKPELRFITPIGKHPELSPDSLQDKVNEAYDLLLKIPEEDLPKYFDKSKTKKIMPSIISQLQAYEIPIPKLLN